MRKKLLDIFIIKNCDKVQNLKSILVKIAIIKEGCTCDLETSLSFVFVNCCFIWPIIKRLVGGAIQCPMTLVQ